MLALREPGGAVVAHLVRAPFLNITDDRIDALEIRRGDMVVRCGRVDGRWQVLDPAGHPVPADLVAALITNLTQLPDVEVVADTAADLSQYGLDTPASQLTLTPRDTAPIVVRTGSRNPAGTAVYAQRSDSSRVFLIGLNVRYYEDLLFAALRPAA